MWLTWFVAWREYVGTSMGGQTPHRAPWSPLTNKRALGVWKTKATRTHRTESCEESVPNGNAPKTRKGSPESPTLG